MEIKLHIILQAPPPNVHFALQKGAGAFYQTEQTQLSKGDDLHFDLTIEAKGYRQTDEVPGFKGPFVQGPAGGKFLYIDIGTYAGIAHDQWSRRLKIPLSGITWAMLNELNANPENVLQTTVPGTAKDGSPTCATVKPFGGWRVNQIKKS